MITIKILATIGIIGILAVLQLAENKALGIETRKEIGLFGWAKAGFIIYLIWFWVDNFLVA